MNTFYSLKPWDLAQQERLIELLHANAILLGTNDSYRALAFAEGEAFLRFPEAINAIHWRWDQAFNLIRIADPQAMHLYTNLFQSAISSGQVRSSDLPEWFTQYETRLTMQISAQPAQPGELNRQLIEIKGEGSAYFWLIETPSGADIYPINNDIDFSQPHDNAFTYADLTGDILPELVIYRHTSPGSTQLIVPRIFNLAVQPPSELPLQVQVPTNFGLEPRADVEIISSVSGIDQLRVINSLSPACPTTVTQQFQWNGSLFVSTPLQYEITPLSDISEYCEIVLNTASDLWGPEAVIKVAQAMLKVWPPEKKINGKPYPTDALDELRYRLGVLYALAGQYSQAISILNEITTSPITPDSSWISPAREFLNAYQRSQDLFTACLQAQHCNYRDALRTLVATSSLNTTELVLAYLKDYGVTIRSKGVFDFDLDGQDERWVIIRPRLGSKLEFWILSNVQEGVRATFVQVLAGTESLPFYHEPSSPIPVVQYELHKGFIFIRLQDTLEPYIDWVDVEYARPTTILNGFTQAVNALMDGEDPILIQNTLLELFNSSRFKGDCIAFKICDQFHYALGFVFDLNGEEGNAIDQYLWVWRNYSQSSFADLARLKLDYFPLPTYTRTPIPSITLTRTRTPSSATPTPTRTATPIFTHTVTFTPSPTATSTFTETITPTATETSTPSPTP